jgi:hypothetical protein
MSPEGYIPNEEKTKKKNKTLKYPEMKHAAPSDTY